MAGKNMTLRDKVRVLLAYLTSEAKVANRRSALALCKTCGKLKKFQFYWEVLRRELARASTRRRLPKNRKSN